MHIYIFRTRDFGEVVFLVKGFLRWLQQREFSDCCLLLFWGFGYFVWYRGSGCCLVGFLGCWFVGIFCLIFIVLLQSYILQANVKSP